MNECNLYIHTVQAVELFVIFRILFLFLLVNVHVRVVLCIYVHTIQPVELFLLHFPLLFSQ